MCYKALIDDRCVGGVGRGGQSRGLGFADAGDSGLVRAVSRGRKRSLGRPAARDIEGEIERENSRLRSSATTKLQDRSSHLIGCPVIRACLSAIPPKQ